MYVCEVTTHTSTDLYKWALKLMDGLVSVSSPVTEAKVNKQRKLNARRALMEARSSGDKTVLCINVTENF